MTTFYSRHPELRLTAIEDEGVVLHLGSLRYFTVNETGLVILQALEQQRTLPEIIAAVTNVYEVSDAEAETTALAFIERCVEARLLQVEER